MRIVIVEDEPRIRDGLARLLAKIGPDYRVVGKASDGLEGLRLVSELRPDLVITDVRMPDLDGLAMLERLRDAAVDAKAIVLSAYSEFSYAREAIRLGVSEYLLKPIKVGDLALALENIERQIASERLARLKEGGANLEGALYSIMLGGAEVDDELRASISSCCDLDLEGNFALATVYLGQRYRADGKRVVDLASATLSRREGLEWRIVDVPRGNRFSIVVFNIDDVESIRDWFESRFMSRMREAGVGGLCVGFGRFEGLGALRTVAQGVDQALEWSIALGGDSLLVWPEVEATRVAPLPYPMAAENEVRAALCAADRARYDAGVADFLRAMRAGEGAHSPRDIKSALVRFFWSALDTAREINYEGYAAMAQQEIIARVESAASRPELEEVAATLSRLFPSAEGPAPSDSLIVARAESLVREFYARGITLNEVAAQIDVTPEYLSALFHRETGATFSAFIRDLRIQKAKELLMSSSLKLYEVGEQVGYRDSKYFCRVFKEATGRRPSEFRKSSR